MPPAGLEPARCYAGDFKSHVSAIPPRGQAKGQIEQTEVLKATSDRSEADAPNEPRTCTASRVNLGLDPTDLKTHLAIEFPAERRTQAP